MPVVFSSAYNVVEDVLVRIRTILMDSEVSGGDIITDTAPNSIDLVQAGYEQVQIELAISGVEVNEVETWFIGLPTVPTIDPEARMIIDDTGCNILYPNGVGNTFASTPQLPLDLVIPTKLWERKSGTTDQAGRMIQPNGGIPSMSQGNYLCEWEWKTDGLRFRGATQSQDVKLMYEKHLPKLAAVTDPVPIRGVLNAAAYRAACIFADSSGAAIAPRCAQAGDKEIYMLQTASARRRQRKQVRPRPYSGRGGRRGINI